MKTRIVLLLSFFPLFVFSQNNLYKPQEFEKAISLQTRTNKGIAGENYFVNSADYTIRVSFNPENGFLEGTETVIYHNNSADTLSKVVFKLYGNIYATGSARDFSIPKSEIGSGMQIKNLNVAGKRTDIEDLRINGTIMPINLNKKLLPGESITFDLSWEYKLPENLTLRNGKYGENIWFVGYWYPHIAVYDDVFGWDNIGYTGVEEFYNDHSNYDVEITVPYPNIVWATGRQQNIFDVFTKNYAVKIKNAAYSPEVTHILTQEDYENGKILKNKNTNTWKFKAEKVPDFAFAVSSSHNWDAAGLSMPDREEPVLVSVVYADSSKMYHSLCKVAREILSYYSFQKPQVYYPYSAMTIFEGGGGMEYPMMVNQGDFENKKSLYYVTAHEMGHTYFPFYTGTNEIRYAWMDEGFITFFPRVVIDDLYGLESKEDVLNIYRRVAGKNYDVPLMTPSYFYKDFYSYRTIAYNRPAYALYVLYDYLGDSLFFAALKKYIENWAYKHPYPYDFFNTFDEVSGEDLSWFWKPYFFEFAKPDLELYEVKFDAGIHITVRNKGGMPQPVEITIVYSDGKTQAVKKKADCWKNTEYVDFYIPAKIKPEKVLLGNKKIIDVDLDNNVYLFDNE